MGWEDISQLLRRLAVFRMARPAGGRKVMPRRTDKTDGWTDGRTDAADGREGSSVQCRFGSGGLKLGV